MFQYNNMLAFAVSGIDNGDPNAPGFVRPPGGPHCIKIHGRTYHRLATADGRRNAVRYVCATLLFSSLLWLMSPFFLRAFESGTLCTMHWTKRSEEHTSELQSLMRISYAVFCLKKKINNKVIHRIRIPTKAH